MASWGWKIWQIQYIWFFDHITNILLANFYKKIQGYGHELPRFDRGKQILVIFEIFRAYIRKLSIFFHMILFGSKILTCSCDRHQKFDYNCSSYPESLEFGHFCIIFGVFQAIHFEASFGLGQWFFHYNLVQFMHFYL